MTKRSDGAEESSFRSPAERSQQTLHGPDLVIPKPNAAEESSAPHYIFPHFFLRGFGSG
jgi:hypothetical protein